MNSEDKKEMEKIAQRILKRDFSKRIGDTPTESLQLTNRKYVDLNGVTANRPKTRVPAQQYFDTTIGRPIYFNPNTSVWTDGAGSVS